MSVINKMLRDLDNRQPNQAAGTGRLPNEQLDLTAGTVALGSRSATGASASAAPADQPGRRLRVGLLLLVVGLVAALGWWANQRPEPLAVTATPPDAPNNATPTAATPTPVTPTPATAMLLATPTPATQPQVTLVAAVASPPAVSSTANAPDPVAQVKSAASIVADAAPLVRERPPAITASTKVLAPKPTEVQTSPKALPAKILTEQLKESKELSSLTLANKSSEPSAVMPPKATPPTTAAAVLEAPKVRPPATQEVLAQAQERWSLGERAPAIALVQDAITRLEGAGVNQATALAALTREYVRMTLAQGQVSAASAMLTRLEQPLAGVADIWALRGNVAQRLGQHPEAVRAYLKSLELRPNEPRWLLGAAVSLAAQGQVGPAGELAEQARQAGALRPDVASYLRQLGVAVSPD